jgi:hypothetical protein
MAIAEPRLTAEFENPDDKTPEREWHAKVLRLLAQQLGVMNDFYFPLLGAAQLLECGSTEIAIPIERGDFVIADPNKAT